MKITKRNGTVHVYDDDKVVKSILNANSRVPDEEISPALAAALAEEVFIRVTREHEIISTADVRECVLSLLRERGLGGTAKSFEEYKKYFEKNKSRFWLIAPVILCLGCAAAAELLCRMQGRGDSYSALGAAIFALIQLALVIPKKKKKA